MLGCFVINLLNNKTNYPAQSRGISSDFSRLGLWPHRLSIRRYSTLFRRIIVKYIIKILNSPLCNYCNLLEILPHMLVECNTVHDFWVKAISWWNSQSGNSYTVHVDVLIISIIIIWSLPAERTIHRFYYYILLGKRYIFVQRLELQTLSLSQFLLKIRSLYKDLFLNQKVK